MDDRGAFIGRALEFLGLEQKSMKLENPSRLDLAHVLASPKVSTFVRDFYAPDLEFFMADPELRHLACMPPQISS